ncbi:hypothetical protein [Methylobacterium nodulans]|uniref:Uncharacterized protein n=1 Tax=Methylobacterium nodulans (strain LMG 21967 / CNCM I-2342 / ORS 2060) TaxID=460265 RepID=B8IH24_METNO|nr:hypothetical protein [Methylobacterium nodulans]ACL57899.1 hypothetical protein Mnod_2948 [Methylobacterium nodulans ORS 2060]
MPDTPTIGEFYEAQQVTDEGFDAAVRDDLNDPTPGMRLIADGEGVETRSAEIPYGAPVVCSAGLDAGPHRRVLHFTAGGSEMAGGWANREKTRDRVKAVAAARALARSGAHADHTTILAALRANGILDRAPSWFGNPAFLLQLDRMCAMACEGARRRTA